MGFIIKNGKLTKFVVDHRPMEVRIPDGVRSIGEEAFWPCGGVLSIRIPESVTTIGRDAFLGCDNLCSFSVDPQNAHICAEDGVLYSKDKTVLIKYPEAREEELFEIPAGVRVIGAEAFAWCRELETIVIPDSVTTIGDNAFWAAGITTVTLPKSVTEMGAEVFRECTELESIKVDPENGYFCDVDGVLYSKDKSTIMRYPIGRKGEEVDIPYGVTAIGGNAFSDCDLESVSIPGSVRIINEQAFHSCQCLREADIPVGVTTIGKSAFSLCFGLYSVHLPNGLTTIGDGAFNCCESLDCIGIPGSVIEIGDHAFSGCTDLDSIYVAPENERYCTVDGVLYSKDKRVLMKCPEGKGWGERFAIPDGVEEIDQDALSSIWVDSIAIPASVEKIGENAFLWCSFRMISVDPRNAHFCSVDGVLYNKEKTVLIKCPERKTYESFVIPDGITEIGCRAFEGCGMTNVVIPRSVKVISREAFAQCYALTAVAIPNSVEEIGEAAFLGCDRLSAVSVTDSVRVIGDRAFHGCENLSYITFMTLSDREIVVGKAAFDDYLTIIAPRDTYMIKYAREHGIEFEAI